MDADDELNVPEVVATLEHVLGLIATGEMTASAEQVAYIRGSVETLRALSYPQPTADA